MKKNLLFFLMAMLMPFLASAVDANGVVALEEIDYCYPSGNNLDRNGRGVNSITFNGTTVQGNGTRYGRALYSDQTATVVSANAGETVDFSISGSGAWMCTYFYIDFDQNGWNVDTTTPAPNGDLVWFNLMSIDGGEDPLYDMQGNAVRGNDRGVGVDGVTGQITIPADIPTGDYRIRYKSAWASGDACGTVAVPSNNTLAVNGGVVIDFTLHVEGAPTAFTFTAPNASDYDNIQTLLFALGGQMVNGGQTVENVAKGTELIMQAYAAAGYVIAGVSVNGVAQQVMSTAGGGYYVQFAVDSNLDKDSFVFNIIRTPYELTFSQPEEGSFTLKAGDLVLESGAMVSAGTIITVETSAPAGKGAHISVNGTEISGNTFEMPDQATEVVVTFADIDYCEPTWTVSRTDRYIDAITVNGTEIEGPGNNAGHPVFVDRTANVVTLDAGEDLVINVNGDAIWTHTYLYADFDKNGWNVDQTTLDLNGDLKYYSCYSLDKNTWYNCEGEIVSNNMTAQGVTPKFTLPVDLAPGDYRVRYKTDWNCTDPCGNTQTGNLIYDNGGVMIDFTLHVNSGYLEAERTIAISTDNDELGSVQFINPAVEGKTLTSALKRVTVKAEAFEGSIFAGWYKGDELVTSETEYVITDTEDVALQARFELSERYTVTIEQPENGVIKVTRNGLPVESGAEVAANSALYIDCVANAGYTFENFVINGEATTDHNLTLTENVTISAVISEGVEYCLPSGTISGTGRYISRLSVESGGKTTTIPGAGNSSGRPLFVDNTDIYVVAEPGRTVTITPAGGGEWMHTYLYGDFDGNGFTADPSVQGLSGDLLFFDYYAADGNNYYDSEGNKRADGHGFIAQATPTFTVPEDLPAGDYRMRYKVEWNNVDPCCGSSIYDNQGTVIDFMLRVESLYLDEPRTIAAEIAEGQNALGQVVIEGAEGNSITTDYKYVTLTATAAEGAQFLGWYKGEELVATTAQYEASDLADATYTARFGWTVTYTIGDGGSLQVKLDDGSNVTSGSALEPGTKLHLVVTPAANMSIDALTVNGEGVEVVEGEAVITIDGVTEISATFTDAKYIFDYEIEGNGEVQAWTEFSDDDSAPAGEAIAKGSEIAIGSDINIYIMPGVDSASGESEQIMLFTITNGNDPEGTLEELLAEDLGWRCEYNDNFFILPYVVAGDIFVSVKYSDGLAGIGDILFDGIEGETEYYNLNGVRVAAENLETGIYIARRGNKAVKVYIRK